MGRDDWRMDAVTAERLLAGDSVGPPSLRSLIAAAASPSRRSELAGEDAAVAAFIRGPRPASHAEPRRTRPAWGRLLAIKIAAVALAAGAGGVALAASTGVLPNPLRADPATPGPTGDASGKGPKGTPGSTPERSPAASPDPSAASWPEVCRAYLAEAAANRGRAQHNRVYAELFTVSGGAEKAVEYCTALLDRAPATPEPERSGPHSTGPPTPRATPARN